jgi:hypothetical protein
MTGGADGDDYLVEYTQRCTQDTRLSPPTCSCCKIVDIPSPSTTRSSSLCPIFPRVRARFKAKVTLASLERVRLIQVPFVDMSLQSPVPQASIILLDLITSRGGIEQQVSYRYRKKGNERATTTARRHATETRCTSSNNPLYIVHQVAQLLLASPNSSR